MHAFYLVAQPANVMTLSFPKRKWQHYQAQQLSAESLMSSSLLHFSTALEVTEAFCWSGQRPDLPIFGTLGDRRSRVGSHPGPKGESVTPSLQALAADGVSSRDP